MPFLTEVHFQNYRSFLDAKCRLSPVTVVIGANNAGKSNFLRGLADLNDYENSPCRTEADFGEDFEYLGHRTLARLEGESSVVAKDNIELKLDVMQERLLEPLPHVRMGWGRSSEKRVRLYTLDDRKIAAGGSIHDTAEVLPNGAGTIRVLGQLKKERPIAFRTVVQEFQKFVPEIEQLFIEEDAEGRLHTTVKENGIENIEALRKVSPGCRTVLAILAIIHQSNAPDLILIEDIEHAIHPRGLKPLVEMMRRISKEHGVQIIFTTQSPYVLDAFQEPEHWDSVVIVEKRDGVSTLTNAKERLVALGYEREMDKVPLGDLWYSGLLGGVAGPNELWDEETPKS